MKLVDLGRMEKFFDHRIKKCSTCQREWALVGPEQNEKSFVAWLRKAAVADTCHVPSHCDRSGAAFAHTSDKLGT